MFDLAIDGKLRGCDIAKSRIDDVVARPEIRTRAIVVQHKTGRPVQFESTSSLTWLEWTWRTRCFGLSEPRSDIEPDLQLDEAVSEPDQPSTPTSL